jgi:hypothetical protein
MYWSWVLLQILVTGVCLLLTNWARVGEVLHKWEADAAGAMKERDLGDFVTCIGGPIAAIFFWAALTLIVLGGVFLLIEKLLVALGA